MKTLIICLVAFLISGCAGKDGSVGGQGSRGEQGEVGEIGPTGLPGQVGPQGNPGANGQDATPVTVVKLCPGVTTYPSTYVEIAFCVGGKLFGTYSANGGFSTELPPGNYLSDGIGNSCNFTVGPNCQVTN